MGEGCATLAHARWHAEESGISIVAIRLTTERESTGGSNPLPALHCLAATCKPLSLQHAGITAELHYTVLVHVCAGGAVLGHLPLECGMRSVT